MNINATILGQILIILSVITTSILYYYSKKNGNVSPKILLLNFVFNLIPYLGFIMFIFFMYKQKKDSS
jgi:hypothetical protein